MIEIRDPGDELIPDAVSDVYYTVQELEGAEEISFNDVTGDTAVRLKDGRIAVLLSIDLV